jgi:monovalent cation:H+ antiporter-2, CPA2 family
VVIAGFGPVGRALADRLSLRRVEFTVIELNPRTVERHLAFGRKFVYGDVTNPEVLEQAGIEHADAVIITIPDEETTLRAVRAVRAMAPETFLAVRTNFLSGKFIALQLGANLVTVEEVATAQAMEREVLDALAKVLPNPAEKTASPG